MGVVRAAMMVEAMVEARTVATEEETAQGVTWTAAATEGVGWEAGEMQTAEAMGPPPPAAPATERGQRRLMTGTDGGEEMA